MSATIFKSAKKRLEHVSHILLFSLSALMTSLLCSIPQILGFVGSMGLAGILQQPAVFAFTLMSIYTIAICFYPAPTQQTKADPITSEHYQSEREQEWETRTSFEAKLGLDKNHTLVKQLDEVLKQAKPSAVFQEDGSVLMGETEVYFLNRANQTYKKLAALKHDNDPEYAEQMERYERDPTLFKDQLKNKRQTRRRHA